ncbi:MAG: prenyltransferase [Gracilibacteraceae bacterium]|jgi:1,4-dihydroxy-2-naphthoate octaprenyltransferase|nr:prenyltransferase [Gracilibacteraceae bacterium]
MYQKLTYKAVKELAAPQTWPAGVLPVLLAATLSYTVYHAFAIFPFVLLLILSVLLQSAVNTLNDYYDYVKGTDTEDNSLDMNDASIIYNRINPRTALGTGMVFLVLALLGGVYCVWLTGWPLLLIGLLGAATIFLYSGGPLPISYLPLGEFISGLMMGGMITLAAVYVFSGSLSLSVLYYALPLIVSIGWILLTNNICDIEKDTAAGRRTLPMLLGRKNAARVLLGGFLFIVAAIAHLAFYSFRPGFWLVLPLLIHFALYLKRLRHMEYSAANRRAAMLTTLRLVTILNSYYILTILWAGVFSD